MTESAPLSAQQGGSGPSSGPPRPPTRPSWPLAVAGPAPGTVHAVCPFLVASDGGWRSASPAREHRCGATDPPSRLPLDRQQHLCLVSAHLDCPLFEAAAGLTVGPHLQEAARAAADLDPHAVPAAAGDPWLDASGAETGAPAFVQPSRAIPRTTPIILDRRQPLDVHLPGVRLPTLRFRRSATSRAATAAGAGGDSELPRSRIAELRAARTRARERQQAQVPLQIAAGTLPPHAGGVSDSRALAAFRDEERGSGGGVDGAGIAASRWAEGADAQAERWDAARARERAPDALPRLRPAFHRDSSAGPGAPSIRDATPVRAAAGHPVPPTHSASDAMAPDPDGAFGDRPAGATRPDAAVPRSADATGTLLPGASRPATPLRQGGASAGPRRFVPPGGPGGFRTLGRVGGSSGGIAGVRTALAGREIQAALAGLMVLALVLVLVVRFSGSGGSAAVAGASSSPRASAGASAGPSGQPGQSGAPVSGAMASGDAASPRPSNSPATRATPKPSVKATPRAASSPATTRTYRVKPGDTLSGIAATYRTTVQTLMRLNHITDPRSLRVGQVLKLP